jgi:heat shock protein HslJ
MRTHRPSLLFALAVLFIAAGCSGSRTATESGVASPALAGPTWRLEAFGESEGAAGAGQFGITAFFGADGRVTGSAGCNRYFGGYDARGETLSIAQIGATRMACDAPTMQREQDFLAALEAARSWERDGDELELEDASGETILSFVANEEATLTGSVTYLPRIALSPDASVTVRLLDVSRADAPAETLAEETITAETAPGQRLSVPVPFTLRYSTADVRPRNRYAVRAEIRGAGGALEWTSDTAIPVLTGGAPDSDVEVRVVQVQGEDRASALPVGGLWRLAQLQPSDGTTVPLRGDEAYTITFFSDGRYSGQADCNRHEGFYEARPGGMVRMERGLSTLAACPSPSSAGAFLEALGRVETYAQAGNRLLLTSDDGAVLVFER